MSSDKNKLDEITRKLLIKLGSTQSTEKFIQYIQDEEVCTSITAYLEIKDFCDIII